MASLLSLVVLAGLSADLAGVVGVDLDGLHPLSGGWVLSSKGYGIGQLPSDQEMGRPPFVEFNKQPLCQPSLQEVVLVNADPRHDLTLFSLESKTEDFHCTFPDREVVPPGKNTSFSIVYLGQSLGAIEASIMINTSHGDLSYEVFADSVENSIRARPFINGRVASGTDYVQPIVLYNPLAQPIQVQEVFTSSPQLQLQVSDVPLGPDEAPSATNVSWTVDPYESKLVVYVHVQSDEAGTVEGYVNIRTNVSVANAIVPVRVAVSDDLGLYFGPSDVADFGAVSVTDPPQTQTVQVLSNTDKLLRVIGASVVKCSQHGGMPCGPGAASPVQFMLKRVSGMMMPKKFTEIGNLVLTPQRGMPAGVHNGHASVRYSVASTTVELTIPFRYQVLEGSLDFPLPLEPAFLVEPDEKRKKAKLKKTVTVYNHHGFNVFLASASLPEKESSKPFTIESFEPTLLAANASTEFTLSMVLGAGTSVLPSSGVLRSEVLVMNNASTTPFTIPVFAFNGSVRISLPGKSKPTRTMKFGDVVMGDSVTKEIVVSNLNPIQIPVQVLESTLDGCAVKLNTVEEVPREVELLTIGEGSKDVSLEKKPTSGSASRGLRPAKHKSANGIVLKPGHQALFYVTVSPKAHGKLSGVVKFSTPYATQNFTVSLNGLKRAIKVTPKALEFSAALPGRADYLEPKKQPIFELQRAKAKKVYIRPDERGTTIDDIKCADPRFVIRNLAGGSKIVLGSKAQVELASVSFRPSNGPLSSNYVPMIAEEYQHVLPPLDTDTLREVERADKVWRRLKKKKQLSISSKIVIESANMNPHSIPVSASLRRLRLVTLADSSIDFPLTQLRHVSERSLSLSNPTKHPVLVSIDMLDAYVDDPTIPTLSNLFDLSNEDVRMARLSRGLFSAAPADGFSPDGVMKPNSNYTFTIKYRPDTAGPSATTLLIRSNLSVVEKLSITAEAGRGTFGFPKSQPCIVDGGLSFPVEPKDLAYCAQPGGIKLGDLGKNFTYNITIVNRGNMPVQVDSMTVNGLSCNAHGFNLRGCEPFELKPKKPYTLTVDFQPDFTSSLVKHKLVVQLAGSPRPLNFLMQATLPERHVRVCFDALPGPEWALRFKATVVATILTLGLLLGCREHSSGMWDPKHVKRIRDKYLKDKKMQHAAHDSKAQPAEAAKAAVAAAPARATTPPNTYESIKPQAKKEVTPEKAKKKKAKAAAAAAAAAEKEKERAKEREREKEARAKAAAAAQAEQSKASKKSKAEAAAAAAVAAEAARGDKKATAKAAGHVDTAAKQKPSKASAASAKKAEDEDGWETKTKPDKSKGGSAATAAAAAAAAAKSSKKSSGGMPQVSNSEKLIAEAKARAAEPKAKGPTDPGGSPLRNVTARAKAPHAKVDRTGSAPPVTSVASIPSFESVPAPGELPLPSLQARDFLGSLEASSLPLDGSPSGSLNGVGPAGPRGFPPNLSSVPSWDSLPQSTALPSIDSFPSTLPASGNLPPGVHAGPAGKPGAASRRTSLANSRPPPGFGARTSQASDTSTWSSTSLPSAAASPPGLAGSPGVGAESGSPSWGSAPAASFSEAGSTWSSSDNGWELPAAGDALSKDSLGSFADRKFIAPAGNSEAPFATLAPASAENGAGWDNNPVPIGQRSSTGSTNAAVTPFFTAADAGNIWSSSAGVLGDLDWATKPDENAGMDPNASSWSASGNTWGAQ